ncbi:SCO family protein [Thiocystis violacea]|uniref:SCO family protein n=1 Tax=Thiocystis violacea TaxID=13725 RepID=UPI0019054AC5|nr:SCO family protein [Thiocystis violacea]MBK1718284.1 SCO family protein [Thiocystis violacea]
MTGHRLLIAILLMAGLTTWLLLFWDPTGVSDSVPDKGQVPLELAARPTGGDFTLDSATGPVRLADLRGQVVLLYFGYTACPDICPTNLVFIANALRGLRQDELERTRVLFVSVDPERDEPRRLAEYAAYFHPRIQGITGTPEQVAQVARLYGAAYRRAEEAGSAMGYLVDHSAYTYVIDPSGGLSRTLDHATPPLEILAAIRSLLDAEQP